MAFCATCGTKNDESAFCINCGTPVQAGASATAAQPVPVVGYVVAPNKTNALAIVSMVGGILGFFTVGLGSLVGIVCGHISLSQIKRAKENGKGMAIAGLVMGYLLLGLGVLALSLVALGTAINGSVNTVSSSL